MTKRERIWRRARRGSTRSSDPNQINQDKDNYLEPTVSALCEVFGYDRADLMAVISANENSYYVPYEKQISADKKEEFEAKRKN